MMPPCLWPVNSAPYWRHVAAWWRKRGDEKQAGMCDALAEKGR